MPVSPDGRRLTCVPVGRGDWTLRALESWRTAPDGHDPGAGPEPSAPPAETGPRRSTLRRRRSDGRARRPARPVGHRHRTRCSSACRWDRWWATSPSGRWASTRWPSRGRRRTSWSWSPPTSPPFADDWSLPEEEALLWVCARELASNSVLTRPAHPRPDGGAAAGLAESSAAAQQDLAGRLGGPGRARGPRGRRAWTSSRCRGCSATPKHCSASCSPPSRAGPPISSPPWPW